MGEFLQIRFHRGDGQATDNGHGFVPRLLVSRSSQKIMTRPSDWEQVTNLAVYTRDGAPVGWEDHCRTVGSLALNEPMLMQQHYVITDQIGPRGWIFRDTIALVKEQQVTDYVQVSLHGLTICAVLVCDGKIAGFHIPL